MDANEKIWRELPELLENYIGRIHSELDARWELWAIDLSKCEMHEVIGALLARQVTLATQLAGAPQIWNSHIAPIILRVMVDVYINLAWILTKPLERSRQFIRYGLGQSKLHIAHRRQQLETDGHDPEKDPLIRAGEDWINSQRYQFLVEVDVGSWSGIDTRKMAEEAGCPDIHRYVYTPFSAAVHSMWQHIGRHNLKQCTNPLHKLHKVPASPELSCDTVYLLNAAKYVDKSFRKFDDHVGAKVTVASGFEMLTKGLKDAAVIEEALEAEHI